MFPLKTSDNYAKIDDLGFFSRQSQGMGLENSGIEMVTKRIGQLPAIDQINTYGGNKCVAMVGVFQFLIHIVREASQYTIG
jgi:hypothetical protein